MSYNNASATPSYFTSSPTLPTSTDTSNVTATATDTSFTTVPQEENQIAQTVDTVVSEGTAMFNSFTDSATNTLSNLGFTS
jgi:hypothetical protein